MMNYWIIVFFCIEITMIVWLQFDSNIFFFFHLSVVILFQNWDKSLSCTQQLMVCILQPTNLCPRILQILM